MNALLNTPQTPQICGEMQSTVGEFSNFISNLSRDELYNVGVQFCSNEQTAVEVIRRFLNMVHMANSGTDNLTPPAIIINDNEINRRISNIFITIGIPPHIKGYQYLRCAIKICVQKTEIISCITKCLYPDVAKQFNTTPSKVERAIRHAIEVCWNRGKIDAINNFFGSTIFTKYDRPTNGEFIALITDKLLLEGV